MNMKTLATIIVFSTLGIAFSAQAHEPKEHMKDAEKPDVHRHEKYGSQQDGHE